MRSVVKSAKRLVVKVGSSLVTNEGRGLDRVALARWAQQIAALRLQGREVVLVSSGAIAEGVQRLGWKRRPHALHELQAAAAVGQMGLIEVYESCFREHGLLTSQILLTHEDLADRKRYLNARSTLRTLLALGVIPIINENDTVAIDEIRFGDNDTLGSLVTNLIEAEVLVILTDQLGLYERDPRKDPSARLVDEGRAGDPALEVMAGGAGTALSLGGMLTKVLARSLAPDITVNAIAPGAVLPPDDWGKDALDHLASTTPLKRLGSPQDVVSAVLYLLESGDYVTGQTLVVDGGRLLR